jgi:PAS domain-containing protein
MQQRSQRLVWQAATPLLGVVVAAYLTWMLPGLRNTSSLFLFLAAVIFTGRIAGWISGLIATALAGILSCWLFMGPGRTFNIHLTEDVVRVAVFLLIALVILYLQASRGKSETALHASQLTRRFWWSKTLEIIYGRPGGEFPGAYGPFFGFIHFDDQPLFNRAITRTIDEGTDYEVDHRIVMPDQSIRWINTRGRVFFNQDSRAERIVGVVTDITAKQKIDHRQQLSRDAAHETPHKTPDETQFTTVV